MHNPQFVWYFTHKDEIFHCYVFAMLPAGTHSRFQFLHLRQALNAALPLGSSIPAGMVIFQVL